MNESRRFRDEQKPSMGRNSEVCGIECNALSGGANSSSEDGEWHGDGAGESCAEITVSTAGESSEFSSVSNRLSRGQSRRNLCDIGEETTRNGTFQHKSLDAVVERQGVPFGDSKFTDENQADKIRSFNMKLEWEQPAAMVSGANTPSGGEESNSELPLCSWSHDNLYERAMEIASRGHLILINFTRRNLGPAQAVFVKQAILSNPHLSAMKLSYNRLLDEGAAIIASGILCGDGSHHGLAILDLGFNSIGDKGAGSIAVDCIAGNMNLQSLYLSGNRIHSEGAMSIAGGVLRGSALSQIHLSANNIGPMGVKAIAGAIAEIEAKKSNVALTGGQIDQRVRSIEELHIGYTLSKSEGFLSIPGMLISNCTIKVLSIPGNHLGDGDMALLTQALTHNCNVPLEQLLLSDNDISCSGLENIMNAVWGSKTLKVLKVDRNRLKDRAAQLCAVGLTSVQMEILDLGFNKIGVVGIKALMKNVSETSSLKRLSLAGIYLDQIGANALGYGLAKNSSLEVLNLDGCLNGFLFQRHVVAGIISNPNPSLRLITGFDICPIAATLGIPKLPPRWANDQVLGFFRYVWEEWRRKSRKGAPGDSSKSASPAKPPAVALAAKVALTSLGGNMESLFKTQPQERSPCGRSPVEPACDSLLELSDSGTVSKPILHLSEASLTDFFFQDPEAEASDASSSFLVSPINRARCAKNQQWLRLNYRSLYDVGQIPFDQSELWKLHQYFFSPPDEIFSTSHDFQSLTSTFQEKTPLWIVAPAADSTEGNMSPLMTPVVASHADGKRPATTRDEANISFEPNPKRPKSQKTRISFFPRATAKFYTLKHEPSDKALAFLRKLRFIENSLFAGESPYLQADSPDTFPSCSDLDMIMIDLL